MSLSEWIIIILAVPTAVLNMLLIHEAIEDYRRRKKEKETKP